MDNNNPAMATEFIILEKSNDNHAPRFARA